MLVLKLYFESVFLGYICIAVSCTYTSFDSSEKVASTQKVNNHTISDEEVKAELRNDLLPKLASGALIFFSFQINLYFSGGAEISISISRRLK